MLSYLQSPERAFYGRSWGLFFSWATRKKRLENRRATARPTYYQPLRGKNLPPELDQI
jgi:hypothetical protein